MKIVLIVFCLFLFIQICAEPIENWIFLTGTEDYINCGYDATLPISNAVTIEAWIHPTSWGTNYWDNTIVGNDAGNSSGFVLRCGANGRLGFTVGMGYWMEALSAELLTLNSWNHVAAVYNGNTMVSTLQLYINGVPSGWEYVSGDILSSPNPIFIGESAGFPGRLFHGNMEEVRIWNIARTEQEINDNMDAELAGSEPNLIRYYKFNETSGLSALDSAGSGYNGILTNMSGFEWVSIYNAAPFTLVEEAFAGLAYEEPGYITPCISSFQHDGTLDLLVIVNEYGEEGNVIEHWKQNSIGSSAFSLQTYNFMNIDRYYATGTFAEIDGDGLTDFFLGYFNISYGTDRGAYIARYEQESTSLNTFPRNTNSFNDIIYYQESYASPFFYDLDDDDKLDLLVGTNFGTVEHYEQIAAHSPTFYLINSVFSGINFGLGYRIRPHVYDYNNDSVDDLFLVSMGDSEIIHYVQDTGNPYSFHHVQNNFNGIQGSKSNFAITDTDNNGYPDLLIGEGDYDGYSRLKRWEVIPTVSTDPITNITDNSAVASVLVMNNPALSFSDCGVVWGTSPNPTINDNTVSLGSGYGRKDTVLTGLQGDVTYYVRGYAYDQYGLTYGQDQSFQVLYNPMQLVGFSSLQITDSIFPGSEDQPIIKLAIETTGLHDALVLRELYGNLATTTDRFDVDWIKTYAE